MFFVWVSRCIPGFSIVALLLLLVFSFPDTVSLPQWIARVQSAGIPEPSELTLPQKVFIIYTVMVHLNTFGFTVRLSWALAKMTVETKRVLNARGTSRFSHGQKRARSIDSPPPALKCLDQSVIKAINDGPEVVHAIIVPNYAEDIDTLITTLKVLAFHPRAASQYEVGP